MSKLEMDEVLLIYHFGRKAHVYVIPRRSVKACMKKIPYGCNDFIKQVLFWSLALLNGNFTVIFLPREKDIIVFLYGSIK